MVNSRRSIGAVLTAAGLMVSSFAIPSETDGLLELLKVLHENKTISAAQYDRLSNALNAKIKPQKEPLKISTKGGLKITSGDGDFKFQIGGRLMVDAAFYDQDKVDLGDGTKLRRARLYAKGVLFKDWKFKTQYDFADNEVSVKDAYIRYTGFKPTTITIGQYKEPFSLEELTSSRYSTFMERALPNAFVPGRNIGVGLHTYGKQWTLAGGLFGEGAGDEHFEGENEGWGTTGRVTFAPVNESNQVVHLGAAVSYRTPNGDNIFSIDSRPESDVTDVKLVDTGDLTMVDNYLLYGAESALVWGPVSLQGEYMQMEINRDGGMPDATLDGWYAYISWFLTGESRAYEFEDGEFARVKPMHNVGKGGFGAWELAARYSMIDLDDGLLNGGAEDNLTLGVNWYVNPHVRFMANYIHVNTNSNAGNDDPNIVQFRGQLDF